MIRITIVIISLSISLFMTGCVRSSSMQNGPNPLNLLLDSATMHDGILEKGLLYNGLFSHTVEPLTFNREPTEVRNSEKQALGRINQFQYPLTSGVSVRVGKNGLGEVAKEHGIKTIYYADLERWTVFFGIWSMDIVHIYGR